MTRAGQWERLWSLFDRIRAARADERSDILERECGQDAALRQEVESLLRHAQPNLLIPPQPPPAYDLEGAPPQSMIGQRIGEFSIVRLVSEGGMGQVFLAKQDRPQREVALKLVHSGLISSAIRRRFEYEADFLARMDHPGIATVFAVGEHGGRPYYAMEYVKDANHITSYCQKHQLRLRGRLELFLQICDAVHYGHQRGIIHRDLKPANLLVDGQGRARVIDFGVARATDGDVTLATMQTSAGALVGTLQYMSPEQCAADSRDLDVRTDVYSLGVVLYQLLCGRPPHDLSKASVPTAVRIISEVVPPPPSSLTRNVDRNLEAIVLKAISKRRDGRYASVLELANDTRAYLSGGVVMARGPTIWSRFVAWVTRNPIAATIVAAVALGVGSGLTAALVSNHYVLNYRLNAPGDMDRLPGHKTARLLSVSGVLLKQWTCGIGEFVFTELLPGSRSTSGTQLALLGVDRSIGGEELCAGLNIFEVEGDLEQCRTRLALRPDTPLPDPHDRGYTVDDFVLKWVRLIDIFDTGGDEAVLVFSHATQSQAIIQIWSLDGSLLYSIWHDGSVVDCEWLPSTRRLVFTGLYGWASIDNRAPRVAKTPSVRYVPVAFAVQPREGLLIDDYVYRPGRITRGSWYKGLEPLGREVGENPQIKMELEARTASRVLLGVHFQWPGKIKTGAPSWHIDSAGNRIQGTYRVPDGFHQVEDRRVGEAWPAFELVDFRSIEEALVSH